MILVVTAILALLGPQEQSVSQQTPRLVIDCTPRSIQVPGQPAVVSANPIASALRLAGPGSMVRLAQGDYPGFTLGFNNRAKNNAKTAGGAPGAPVVVQGQGRVRLLPMGRGDTISIHQDVANGHFVFRNLEIIPGSRAGVLFFIQPAGRVHRDFAFEDCHILGSWDHRTGKGATSKWGIWAHSLDGFRFEGVNLPSRVERIRWEHGFYIENPCGPVTIANVRAKELGRTFCQFTAREKEGPPGSGPITVRDCVVSDCGLSRGDAFKGGTAFTLAGRITGTTLIERNTYRAGFDPSLRGLTHGGAPYGTGALVAWQGGERVPNGVLVLRDNDFAFAPGCGDRPVVSLGGCRRVVMAGSNRFSSGGNAPALAIDPVDGRGRLTSSPLGRLHVDDATVVEGGWTVRGIWGNK